MLKLCLHMWSFPPATFDLKAVPDPLSKPKVDNVEALTKADDGERASSMTAEDPWDAVLLEEKLLVTCHLERKVNGKSSGATVTRSQSLNMRTTQFAKLQGQMSQVCKSVFLNCSMIAKINHSI